MHAIGDWLSALLWTSGPYGERTGNTPVLKAMQIALRLEKPLAWGRGADSAALSVENRMQTDREFALDVLDFFVQKVATPNYADELGEIFTLGGSEWEVTKPSEERRYLAKRTVAPVDEIIEALPASSERARRHLEVAWLKLVGRNPDPSAAYREAIRAVEAAAKPVVIPSDPTATLGKIIRAIRDKPEKWTVLLDDGTPQQIADMCDLIWKGQQDRHGTDDPSTPLNVSQEEADVAVHVAVSLTRIFAGGGFQRASDTPPKPTA
jgi:hypothetical protein